jgi:hypothetical protein
MSAPDSISSVKWAAKPPFSPSSQRVGGSEPVLVGFHPTRTHANARDYPVAEFVDDAEAVGLRVQHQFGSYDLAPASGEYCVAVLARA